MIKRFFVATDDCDVDCIVVAVDLDHAKSILRDSGAEFGDPSEPLDKANLEWSEMTHEKATTQRCHTDDHRGGVVPLADCEIGEWFCSEW